MNPCIVGWAHTKFGRLGDETVESLMVRVTREALDDARVSGADVDGIFVGLFNNGFSEQDFPSSLPFHANESLRFKPATRYENACATGSAAIHGALDFIAAGRGRIALVVGAEKMTDVSTAGATQALRGASYLREEAAHPGRAAFDPPEMLTSDLAPLLLSLAQWGAADPAKLAFLDPLGAHDAPRQLLLTYPS